MVIQLDVDLRGVTETTRAVERVLPNAQRHVEVAVLRRVRQRTVARLRTAPRPNNDSDYPLTWRSERQRRFVMAKLRRENNLPYRRTGRLVAGWAARAQRQPDGALIEVVNPSRVLDFVAGEGNVRQPMFPRWYSYPALLRTEAKQLERELVAYFERRVR